ncbi:MAG: hypothetical protein WDZ29_04845 [Balneolaceae bacterium]
MAEHSSDTDSDSQGPGGLFSNFRRYFERRFELLVLSIAENVSLIFTHLIQRLTGIIVFSTGLFFAWLALGFFLAEWVESYAFGFFISSLPLILIGYIFMKVSPVFISRRIHGEIMREVISRFDEFREDEDEGAKKKSTES